MGAAKQDSATFNMTCLLREWDRAPKEKRRQLLQDFIDQHCNRSGPELELELAQMASLFLARICVWVKLTYMTGTCLTEQLQVLYIFLSAASSHNFLSEFLQNGGILCLQELCVFPNAKEIDKYWALRVLSCVANGGTRYKETICECYGIRAVAECMAKSTSEKTREAARDVLEQLAEGNPRFRDQVYKGLIAVLPCDSAKAQQLALQSIRILQAGNPLANRALIDRVICIMESLHLSVQAAALELVRGLMQCDIANDILKALVSLLHPQREIELGKLFNESTKSISDSSDSEETKVFDVKAALEKKFSKKTPLAPKAGVLVAKPSTLSRRRVVVNRRSRGASLSRSSSSGARSRRSHSPSSTDDSDSGTTPAGAGARSVQVSRSESVLAARERKRREAENAAKALAKEKARAERRRKETEEQAAQLPLPVFVQQASAAKCIRALLEDSLELNRKLLEFGALSGLLYAMGNLEFPDSQRQASLAVKFLCERYSPIRDLVSHVMGQSFYDAFMDDTDTFYLHMTPLQADLLVSNKMKFGGIEKEIDFGDN